MAFEAPGATLPVVTWRIPRRLRAAQPTGTNPDNPSETRPLDSDYRSLRPQPPNDCAYFPTKTSTAHRYRGQRWRQDPPRRTWHEVVTWGVLNSYEMVDFEDELEHTFLRGNSRRRDVPVYNYALNCFVSSPDNAFICQTMDDLYFFLLHLGPQGRREIFNVSVNDLKATSSDTYFNGALALLQECARLRSLCLGWCSVCSHCRLPGTRQWDAWLKVRLLPRRANDARGLDVIEYAESPCKQCSGKYSGGPATPTQRKWAAHAGPHAHENFRHLRLHLLQS